MTKHFGVIAGERIDQSSADAIAQAFPGISLIAQRLQAPFGKSFEGDPDGGLVSPAAMSRVANDASRFCGVRDVLVADHPVVIALMEKLRLDAARVPAPDDAIVAGLSNLRGFAFDGRIVTIHSVPLPAGEAQTRYFMVQRYRPLYGPGAEPHLIYRRDPDAIAKEDYSALGVADADALQLIHLVAYDAANVTDDMQKTLLTYSTRLHRDNLVALQRDYPRLYVAIWRRDLKAAKRLILKCRGLPLPPSNPASKRSRTQQLLHGTALMAEFERLFEIVSAVKVEPGVTRQSIARVLKACRSMSDVLAIDDPTHRFVVSMVAHLRSMHPTMNDKPVKKITDDAILERVRASFFNARGYWERTRRVSWPGDEMPAQLFLGVEPAMLAIVALIQMVWTMARLEPNFWLYGQHDHAANARDARHILAVELGIIITGNLCSTTARSMLPADRVDEELAEDDASRTDEEWRDTVVPSLIHNPGLAAEVESLAIANKIEWPEPPNADCDRPRRNSPYERALERASALVAFGQPGWTQGFLFDAWLHPDAEVEFLRRCCRYIQYAPARAAKREARDTIFRQRSFKDGKPVGPADVASGLPRHHPVGHIQDLFRDPFDRVQVADGAGSRATRKERAWREAVVANVAPLLAAVSPITLDPQLAERWWRDLNKHTVATAAQWAWDFD